MWRCVPDAGVRRRANPSPSHSAALTPHCFAAAASSISFAAAPAMRMPYSPVPRTAVEPPVTWKPNHSASLVGAVVHAAPEHGRHVVAARRANDVAVGVGVQRRRFLHADQRPVRLHFLGRHHRERRRRALPHLAVRHQDRDDVVGGHRDPGGQLPLLGRIGGHERVPAGREREAGDAEQEAAAGDGAGADERTPRPFPHVRHDAARGLRRPRGWPRARARTCRSGRRS